MAFEAELDAMRMWADEADRIAMAHFRGDAPATTKADGTPVTVADRSIEAMVRTRIADAFPGDAILGEEQGSHGRAERRWIVDPIDGTKNFARGVPVFATLLAFEVRGDQVAAVVSAPALGTRWWATTGGGAFRDGTPIRVSSTADIARACLASGDALRYASAAGKRDAWIALCDRVARHRGFGDFWGHMLVAEGAVDAMVEFPGVAAWDLAAVAVIVREAGGRMTSLSGRQRIDEGDALSSNGLIHDEVLAALA